MKFSVRPVRAAQWLLPSAACLLLAAPYALSDDTLVWARYGDIDTLDPHGATSTLSMQVWHQIYDTLLARDSDGQPVPNMAESWAVSDDGLMVSFNLHDDILCHDGSAFDAEDVVYTWERAFSDSRPSNTQSAWGPVTHIDTPDSTTAVFHFSEPFAAFVPFMADPFASMLCRGNEDEAGFGTSAAIGTGPWVFESWRSGDRILLSSNPDYINRGRLADNPGSPYMAELEIRVLREGQSRLAALRSGEVHIAEPPIEAVSNIQSDAELDLYIADNTGQNVFIEFAISRAPFDDVRARRAVAYAIDPDVALQLAFGDLVNREWCTVAQGVAGNDQDFCRSIGYEHDPEQARALLAELGHDMNNPLEVKFMTWTGGNRQRVLQVFQNQLRQVGINASLEVMDIGSLNAQVQTENLTTSGRGSMDMMGWSWYDPDILHQLWHSPGAYQGYNSAELDEMLHQTRVLSDEAERLAMVQNVQQYLIENAVHIPLYTPGWEWLYAARSNIDGFIVGPFNQPDLIGVRLND